MVIFPQMLLNQVRRVTFVKMQLLLPQYVAPNRPRQWSPGKGHFLFLFEQRGALTFMPCLASIICVHCQSVWKELKPKKAGNTFCCYDSFGSSILIQNGKYKTITTFILVKNKEFECNKTNLIKTVKFLMDRVENMVYSNKMVKH